MWKTKFNSTINGSVDKAWKALVTPSLWKKIDPVHYKKVEYTPSTLEVGTKGKMAAEGSQTFAFKPVVIDEANHLVITESSIPFGKLRITKKLVVNGKAIKFEEEVLATGPLAKLFSKLFFEKQIKATLPGQHEAIKKYVEGSWASR